MAMDMNAALKITASVNGGAAIDQLKTSMDRLDGVNSKLVKGFEVLKAAGALLLLKEAIQGVAAFTATVLESMTALKGFAEQSGSTVENMSALADAAKMSGTTMESVTAAMVKLTMNLKNVDADSRGSAEALKFLGINFNEFKKLDPAEQMLRVAIEMEKFKDGTGKTALMLDLLGKSGASMIPFLKELNDAGALNVKVSSEQAEMADVLEKNFIRLKMQFFDSSRALLLDLIPAFNAFVGGMNEALSKTQLFANNDAIKEFAEITAKSLAVLIDVFVAFYKAASALSGSFSAVFADIKLAGTFMFGGVGLNPFSDENKKILSDALAERNKIVEDANNRYRDLWNFDGSAFFNAVSKRMDNQEPPAVGDDKPSADYTPRGDEKKDKLSDFFTKKLESQMQMVEKYKFQQEALLETQSMEALSIDMTAIAYKNLSEARQFDLKNAEMSVGLLPQAKAALDEITESLKQQKIELNNLDYAQQRTFEYGAKTFLKGYLEEVTNTAKQVQQVMSNAFKGVEDALVEFTMTGKLNFKDMIDSLLRDMIRLQIQQGIMKHLTNFVSGFVGSMFGTESVGIGAMTPAAKAKGDVFGGAVQQFAAGGIFSTATPFKFANGGMMRNGVMGEAGPEAIMPLKRGADGKLGVAGAGGGSTSVVVNNYGDKQASVQEKIDSRGNRRIEVTIGELVANEVRRAGSAAHSSVRDTFGARPALVGR